MPTRLDKFFLAVLACGLMATLGLTVVAAQSTAGAKNAPADASPAQKALNLAEAGRCREALPILRKAAPLAADKDMKMKAGLAAVRCGLQLNQAEAVVNTLVWLNRDFPSDPDVLYVTTHAYSDLSTRAALRLAGTAPASVPALELNAEALESQGKWDEAAAQYQAILKQRPDTRGIHYRMGRILLSKPQTPTTLTDARSEFEAELKLDTHNAGAEYILGEMSRQGQQWDDAIDHFSKASKLDASFADAFLGLGFSLNSVGRFADAIPPLETGVKLQPGNPTGHYQLAIAYNRVGRKDDAKREAALQKETADRIEQDRQNNAEPPQ